MIELNGYSSAKCKDPNSWCTGSFLEEQRGSDSMSARDTLDKVRASGGGGQTGPPFCPPAHCCASLSSCGSNFHSTSVFINLLLASQGDRIQTLTRISPPDWLDTATPRGHSTKKKKGDPLFFTSFSPLFTSTCFPPPPAFALYIICPSISYPLLLLPLFYLHPSFHPSILHLILFFPRASLLVSQLSEWHSTSSFSVMDRRRRVLTE